MRALSAAESVMLSVLPPMASKVAVVEKRELFIGKGYIPSDGGKSDISLVVSCNYFNLLYFATL